jgi:flagellar protein FlgJ
MQIDTTAGHSIAPLVRGAAPDAAHSENLRAVAQDLEAAFLAEMLKHAGFGGSNDSFGGGVGEAQFASFLTQEHARLLAERGGIGLAENIYRALVARGAP